MKRTYSNEFKIKACELVIKDNIAVSVVALKMRHSITIVVFSIDIDR